MLEKKHTDQKVSKMLLDVAEDYVVMGEGIQDKQRYLNSAVSARNIACLDSADRERAPKRYIESYRRLNPSVTHRDCTNIEENIKILISKKDKLYPQVRIQLTGAAKEEEEGQERVAVASVHVR
ncbi:hypothetical protein D4R47_03005 [archaeon]|nr:MAG: hypothetical protein D4R47_03005 [archaeon]